VTNVPKTLNLIYNRLLLIVDDGAKKINLSQKGMIFKFIKRRE
jgi:hypothetical protein